MSKRVAVALSGGVDSAVTALLLKEQGYDIVGLTGKMTATSDAEVIVENAKKVADKIGIEHYVLDVSKNFDEKIITYFKESYIKGKTPNPCIMCNKFIKWGELFDYAINDLKVDYIATGHYANIKNEGGIYKLYPASDEHKDQLYFLFMLDQEHLSKTLFPLSNYKKSEVKELAIKYDLPPKSSKESQDICFIKAPMTTKKFLNNIYGVKKGKFVEKVSGKVLGEHDGFWQYTIGQRKGIGIAYPYPLYVIGLEPSENIVYVGAKEELFSKELFLDSISWNYEINENKFEALVKIRYNMPAILSNVEYMNNKWRITFNEAVSAITPGQACVIYDRNDGHLLGGSFVE